MCVCVRTFLICMADCTREATASTRALILIKFNDCEPEDGQVITREREREREREKERERERESERKGKIPGSFV